MPLVRTSENISREGTSLEKATDESEANTALTVSSPSKGPRRILFATVKYSAVPVQGGVTATLKSGTGSAWDTLLETGAANAQATVYIPNEGDSVIADGDKVDITAPAAGGVITSAITLYTEGL